MLYLIEGLDCSGKKEVASKVETLLSEYGLKVNIIIGSAGSKIVQLIEKKLVQSFFVKKGSLVDSFRKKVYTMEPIIDGVLYRHKVDVIDLKISSHYRAWARAIVENDNSMVCDFAKYKKQHIDYDGATLLTVDFDTRIERHRKDYISGKTNKIEEKRFFNNNKSFFDKWDSALFNLISNDVTNQEPINTKDCDSVFVANIIVQRIMELHNSWVSPNIIMLKPDALDAQVDGELVYNLLIAFANHLKGNNEPSLSNEMNVVASEAYRHTYERSLTEKSFSGDTRIVPLQKIYALMKYADNCRTRRNINVADVIICGIEIIGYEILHDKLIQLSASDVERIYPRQFIEDDSKNNEWRLHLYLDNQKVRIIQLRGRYGSFILQHLKTYVRHFLIMEREEPFPLKNLIHVSDEDDYDYLMQIVSS